LVELDREAAEVRNAMRQALANGAEAAPARPPKPVGAAGGKRAAVMAKSQEADAQVLSLLRDKPMQLTDVAKATGAKGSTAQARMKRLAQRNLISCDSAGLWSASATAAS
jgi:hypothetical protein